MKNLLDNRRFLGICGLFLIALNILLAVVLPIMLSTANKELATILIMIQHYVLLPIFSVIGMLWIFAYIKNKEKRKISSKEMEKNQYNIIGRLAVLGIAILFLMLYTAYEIFVNNNFTVNKSLVFGY